MKETRKKGFTLIELLAVLVVLAILALISVPIVLNIINQSRQKARLRSVEGFAKAVESAVYVYEMENPDVPESSISLLPKSTGASQYDIGTGSSDTKKVSVEYSGSQLTDCTLSMNDNKIELSSCKVDGNGTYYYYDGGAHDSAKTTTGS